MVLKVECHAGYTGEERPVRFYSEEQWQEIEEIIEQWREPDAAYFRIRTRDGREYLLKRASDGIWMIV